MRRCATPRSNSCRASCASRGASHVAWSRCAAAPWCAGAGKMPPADIRNVDVRRMLYGVHGAHARGRRERKRRERGEIMGMNRIREYRDKTGLVLPTAQEERVALWRRYRAVRCAHRTSRRPWPCGVRVLAAVAAVNHRKPAGMTTSVTAAYRGVLGHSEHGVGW